jgi:hypothetical protein
MSQWAEAYADASAVPDDFVFWAQMDELEEVIFNDLYEAQNGQFRSYTIEFTWFNDHYETTGDPRTPWETDPEYATTTASLQGFGGAPPFKRQLKYISRDSDFRLVSGWEMRLVEAEAILQGAGSGDFNDALALINQVRTRNLSDLDGQPLAAVTAADATETWTALKRERYIELWLEGRRMGDERRWAATSTPGDLDTPNWEDPSDPGYTPLFTDNPRSYCFDIPEAERDRNPNVPAPGG